MPGHGVAGRRNGDGCQLLGSVEREGVAFGLQQPDHGLTGLEVDGGESVDGLRHQVLPLAQVGEDLVADGTGRLRLVSQADAHGEHLGNVMKARKAGGAVEVAVGDEDDGLEAVGTRFAPVGLIEDGDVRRTGGGEIVGAFVAHAEDKGHGTTAHEGEDDAVLVGGRQLVPPEALPERVERP